MKALLVGEDNPHSLDPRHALYPWPPNTSGWRLCYRILDLTLRQYLKSFDRVNLCSGPWNREEAIRRAAEIKLGDWHENVVLLGYRVAVAFGFGGSDLLSKIEVDGKRFYLMPHPSGVNRFWNDPIKAKLARAHVGGLLERGL